MKLAINSLIQDWLNLDNLLLKVKTPLSKSQRGDGVTVTHPKVLEPKVLDPKVLVTKVLGSLNQGINWLYPVSDVKSLIGFTAYFGN